MRISSPLYERLPLIYVIAGALLLYGSYRLHSGSLSLLLMIVGAVGAIAGIAIWLRRRDFRAANAEYSSRNDARDSGDDALR